MWRLIDFVVVLWVVLSIARICFGVVVVGSRFIGVIGVVLGWLILAITSETVVSIDTFKIAFAGVGEVLGRWPVVDAGTGEETS